MSKLGRGEDIRMQWFGRVCGVSRVSESVGRLGSIYVGIM